MQNGQTSSDSKLCGSQTLAACATEVRHTLQRKTVHALELSYSSAVSCAIRFCLLRIPSKRLCSLIMPGRSSRKVQCLSARQSLLHNLLGLQNLRHGLLLHPYCRMSAEKSSVHCHMQICGISGCSATHKIPDQLHSQLISLCLHWYILMLHPPSPSLVV